MGKNEKEKNSKNENTKTPKGNSLIQTVGVTLISGCVGASLVIGTFLCVPQLRTKLFDNNETEITEKMQKVDQNSSNIEQNLTAISLQEYSDTAVGVAAKVLPSIVGIKIEYNVNSYFGKGTATATGSGIIISEDGNILTNNHVVSSEASNSGNYYQVTEAKSIKVKLYNDETLYDATIVGKDDITDLAVIKIDKTGLVAAEIGDSDSVKVGEFAMAIGNPQGLSTSVTCGIISAVNREITADSQKYTVIQTDAAINSGNSGGALVNSKGQVIGVNTLKLSGTGVEGIGFAIPMNSTTDIVKQLIEHNKVLRPYIGIEGISLNEKTAERYNLVEGVYVRTVEDFTAAQKAGVKSGDVITEIDGKKVTSVDEINNIKLEHKIGDLLTLKIYRNKEYKTIELALEEQP